MVSRLAHCNSCIKLLVCKGPDEYSVAVDYCGLFWQGVAINIWSQILVLVYLLKNKINGLLYFTCLWRCIVSGCSMLCHSSTIIVLFRTTLTETIAWTFHSSSPCQGFEYTSPMTKMYFVLAVELLGIHLTVSWYIWWHTAFN